MAFWACLPFMPSYWPALAFRLPSSLSRLMDGRPDACPISKSVGSCPGVTLSTPDPKSRSTFSLPTMGICLHSSRMSVLFQEASRLPDPCQNWHDPCQDGRFMPCSDLEHARAKVAVDLFTADDCDLPTQQLSVCTLMSWLST